MRVWKKKGELRGRAGEDSCPPGLPVACGVKEIDFGDSCVHLSQSFKLFDAVSSFKTVQTPGSPGLPFRDLNGKLLVLMARDSSRSKC